MTDRLELPILGNGDFLEYGSPRISAVFGVTYVLSVQYSCAVVYFFFVAGKLI